MRRGILIVLAIAVASAAFAWTPTDVKQDPLVRMPGTQPAPEGNDRRAGLDLGGRHAERHRHLRPLPLSQRVARGAF